MHATHRVRLDGKKELGKVAVKYEIQIYETLDFVNVIKYRKKSFVSDIFALIYHGIWYPF